MSVRELDGSSIEISVKFCVTIEKQNQLLGMMSDKTKDKC